MTTTSGMSAEMIATRWNPRFGSLLSFRSLLLAMALAAATGWVMSRQDADAGIGAQAVEAPELTDSDLFRFKLNEVVEVNDDSADGKVDVSRAEAIEIARAQLDWKDEAVRTYQGSAVRYVDEEPHSVWIVVLRGGVAPGAGPAGAEFEPPPPPSLTGVLVDDATGEAIRWFQR